MKHLKITFLLAAAMSQLVATDYLAVWNSSNGKTATATIGVDPALFSTSSSNSWNNILDNPWLTKLDMVFTDSSNNVIASYTKSNLQSFVWNPAGHNLAGVEVNTPYPLGSFLISHEQYGVAGFAFYSAVFYKSFSGSIVVIDSIGPAFSGVTDVVTWMSSINDQSRTYMIGWTLAGLPLEGAHHRPMMSFDRMGKESQAWATGDFGSSSRTRDVHVTTGEAGLNWNVGKTGLIGFAAGHGVQNQDLAYEGSSATKGDFFIAEFDFRPEGTQCIISLLGMVGSWESKTNRG